MRKTKVMVTSEGRDHTFTCNGEALEQVEPFRYLGAVITSTGDCSVEISSRPGITRSALTSMNNLWSDRALNKETKVRLKRALVWPVATYGCESWTLKASDKKRIAVDNQVEIPWK